MKDLIIKALDIAMAKLDSSAPLVKKTYKSISILNVKPIDILSFMKENNVPDDAEFDGNDNGCDAWDDVLLVWYANELTTDKDKVDYKRKKFNSFTAFINVHNILTTSGYKRQGSSSNLFKQFDDTTVYDMYMGKDFDRLVKYYSLSFVKV